MSADKGRFIVDGAVFDGDLCCPDWFVTAHGQFNRFTGSDWLVCHIVRWSEVFDKTADWLNIIEEK